MKKASGKFNPLALFSSAINTLTRQLFNRQNKQKSKAFFVRFATDQLALPLLPCAVNTFTSGKFNPQIAQKNQLTIVQVDNGFSYDPLFRLRYKYACKAEF